MIKLLQNKKYSIAFIVIIIIIAARFSSLDQYITLQVLQEKQKELFLFVQEHYFFSVFLYIGLYVFIVAVSLPLAAIMTVGGGFLYGVFPGVIYSNIGATGGATISFLIARYLLGNYIQHTYKQQLLLFNHDFEKYGIWYLLLIHLVAFIPFFIVNIAAALTKVSLWTFIWTTFVGIFPGALVYAYAGKQLQGIESIYDIFTPHIILLFLVVALLGIIPLVIVNIRKKVRYANAK